MEKVRREDGENRLTIDRPDQAYATCAPYVNENGG